MPHLENHTSDVWHVSTVIPLLAGVAYLGH